MNAISKINPVISMLIPISFEKPNVLEPYNPTLKQISSTIRVNTNTLSRIFTRFICFKIFMVFSSCAFSCTWTRWNRISSPNIIGLQIVIGTFIQNFYSTVSLFSRIKLLKYLEEFTMPSMLANTIIDFGSQFISLICLVRHTKNTQAIIYKIVIIQSITVPPF